MLSKLVPAILEEIKLLMSEKLCTVMLESDFNIKSAPSYSMPLILVGIKSGQSYNLIGNYTRREWSISIKIYTIVADLYSDNTDSYDLFDTVEQIQEYFSLKIWQNDLLKELRDNYSFIINLENISETDVLPIESISKGYELNFGTILLTDATAWTQLSKYKLQNTTFEIR